MNAAVIQSKPKLPNLVSLILIMILGVSLSKLMWLILTPEKKVNTQMQAVNTASDTRKQEVNYGKLIANQHIFGQVKKVAQTIKAPPKAAPVPAPPPAVKLNLKLHGIVAYKSKDGYALISLNNGRQKVYGKGDELEKGVYVRQIFPEKVVLDNNGQTEELSLPVKKIKKKSKDVATNNKPRSAPRVGGYKDPTTPPPIVKDPRNSPPDLANFREQVMANPRRLMDIATPSAAVVDGDFIGFRVQPGRERKLFRQLGFRPNDIITEVNGIVLNDASKGPMVLAELAQATDVSVTIKRGDQEIFIQHSF